MVERTKVVNIKRELYDVLIDRTTEWGNLFIIGRDGTRTEVIEKHRKQILRSTYEINKIRIYLRGKRLG